MTPLLSGRRVFMLVVVAGAVLYPVIASGSANQLLQLENMLAMIMVCIGLNVVIGFAGQVFLGPSATFAVATFVVAGLALHSSPFLNLGLMIVVGCVAGVLLGLVMAGPALRFRGFYLGIATLYIAVAVPTLSQNLSITGGSEGLSLLAVAPTQSPSGTLLYEIGVIGVVVLAVVSAMFLRARIGQRLNVLASSEELAAAVGIGGYRTKLTAFLIGSAMIGVGGAYFTFTQQYTGSATTSASLSILILAAVVIGGAGTIWGPIIGGAIVFGPSVFLGGLNQYQDIIFGVLLIVVVVAYPGGLASIRFDFIRRQLHREERPVTRPADTLAPTDEPSVDFDLDQASRALWIHLAEGTDPETKLEILDVRRLFNGVPAIDGVNITITPGAVHAIIGPNGSGKTTLLNLVSGFLRLDGGSITLGGQSVEGWNASQIAGHGISRTFQTPKLMVERTTAQNVAAGALTSIPCGDTASALGLPSGRRAEEAVAERTAACLDAVSLSPFAATPAGLLSHGAQRLVEVARTLAGSPKFVLLDEPAAGLSPGETAILKACVRRLVAAGIGVVLVEHNLPVVFDLADTVTVLDVGRVLFRGTPEEVAASPDVARAYLGTSEQWARLSSSRGTRDGSVARHAGADEVEFTVRSLRAGYGVMEVVSDIDLEVGTGEFVALVGRNGAGKTTMLSALAGLRHGQNGGSVRVGAVELGSAPPWKITAAGLALVPEGKRIFTQMSVIDNLRVGLGANRPSSREEADQRLERVLALFPLLKPALERKAGDLSGGGQQMVAVGQALMGDPRFLLLDEPASGLAPTVVIDLFEALKSLCADGMGILIVDQSVERAQEMSDRILVMEDGRLVLSGPSSELRADDITEVILGSGNSVAPGATVVRP